MAVYEWQSLDLSDEKRLTQLSKFTLPLLMTNFIDPAGDQAGRAALLKEIAEMAIVTSGMASAKQHITKNLKTKNGKQQMLILMLIDGILKETDFRFHQALLNKAFLELLLKELFYCKEPKANPEAQEYLLGLLSSWKAAYTEVRKGEPMHPEAGAGWHGEVQWHLNEVITPLEESNSVPNKVGEEESETVIKLMMIKEATDPAAAEDFAMPDMPSLLPLNMALLDQAQTNSMTAETFASLQPSGLKEECARADQVFQLFGDCVEKCESDDDKKMVEELLTELLKTKDRFSDIIGQSLLTPRAGEEVISEELLQELFEKQAAIDEVYLPIYSNKFPSE